MPDAGQLVQFYIVHCFTGQPTQPQLNDGIRGLVTPAASFRSIIGKSAWAPSCRSPRRAPCPCSWAGARSSRSDTTRASTSDQAPPWATSSRELRLSTNLRPPPLSEPLKRLGDSWCYPIPRYYFLSVTLGGDLEFVDLRLGVMPVSLASSHSGITNHI